LPIDIAFLAVAEAQQVFHWLPAALELGKRADVRVHVLSPSRLILDLVASYDPEGRLDLIKLRRPSTKPDSLFRLPSRLATLLLNYRAIARFPTLVTTEITSAWLKRMPGFATRLILIKHGAGDRAGGYKQRHADFDLTIVAGEKDRRRMIEYGRCTDANCLVGGYAKFELRAPRRPLFDDDKPVLLYNPHFDPDLSSWVRHGPQVMAALEALQGWNVIIAPHVKLARRVPPIHSDRPHIRVDMGSRHSIDMSYTTSADAYLGDVSSQVYEFLLTPRPCIFLNLDRETVAALLQLHRLQADLLAASRGSGRPFAERQHGDGQRHHAKRGTGVAHRIQRQVHTDRLAQQRAKPDADIKDA